jgi:hypothetical protein
MMTQIGAIDIQMVTAMGVGFFLICCVVLFYCIRDPMALPLHRVTRTLWCPTHARKATVEFSERVSTGITIREVERCSLLERGRRCNKACRDDVGLAPKGRGI